MSEVRRRMTEVQSKELKAAWQRRVAQGWVDGVHLHEVAARHGLDLAEARRVVAFGLLGLGKVSVDDLIRCGFLKPRMTFAEMAAKLEGRGDGAERVAEAQAAGDAGGAEGSVSARRAVVGADGAHVRRDVLGVRRPGVPGPEA